MSNLRRYFSNGQTSFLTNVTCNRFQFLVDYVDLFHDAITVTLKRTKFEIAAWVIMPDHFHIIIETENENPSDIMRRLKLSFSTRLRGMVDNKSGRIWQYRFWDHIIRNQDDLNRHIDYIHYNPVKHLFVQSPFDWVYSSIHDYQRKGVYDRDWGINIPIDIDSDFGE
jgi:putative transposase